MDMWSILGPILLVGVVFLGLEVLSVIVPVIFGSFARIPIKGKHLDELSTLDQRFILINKLLTVLFVYHTQLYLFSPSTTTIQWTLSDLTLYNTLGTLMLYYTIYDLLYSTFHRVLHWRSLYALIHKHHHRQKAPSRGNLDAINVHPFEFLVGEYLHLLTIYVVPGHIVAVTVFILAGGLLASLNHTRFDVQLSPLYSVRVHDVHHRLPESNYGQYTVFWDWVFGSYRSYDRSAAVTDLKDD